MNEAEANKPSVSNASLPPCKSAAPSAGTPRSHTGSNRRARGAKAERFAQERLKELGYRIIHTNWRCRTGEIDIVARHGAYWVFVEVRSRQSRRFGTAAEAFDRRKQQQVRATAQVYLHQHAKSDVLVRFDAVAVTFREDDDPEPEIVIYEAAF
ncbi:YraN family protein [Paenibacillus sp. MER TA 81-3]|uniref:YraN family protein n=1 Tax=Paenibacillus sp. MER TA 81-3 TaxID=2939573 RepID=UPI00203A8BDD|nr:YraN family protein [Paenibacillus sp. MER TA 81-3]MCM3337288.1 YraN family protein [Paenibacillus sp. MER TA 81-3]